MDEEIVEREPDDPNGRMFTAGQVLLAAAIGSPAAGCILLGLNYRTLGQSSSAVTAVLAGVASTVVLLVVSFFLPERFPNFILPAAYCLALYHLTTHYFGAEIERYAARNQQGSWLAAAAVGVACLVLLLLFLVATVFLVLPDDGRLP